jgi:hypothetical protein
VASAANQVADTAASRTASLAIPEPTPAGAAHCSANWASPFRRLAAPNSGLSYCGRVGRQRVQCRSEPVPHQPGNSSTPKPCARSVAPVHPFGWPASISSARRREAAFGDRAAVSARRSRLTALPQQGTKSQSRSQFGQSY